MPADPRPVLDHCGLTVFDMARSTAFYAAVLGALGLSEVDRFPEEGEAKGVAYGLKHPSFWITPADGPVARRHVGFFAETCAQVDTFHAAGLNAGGADHGAPGERHDYDPGYYAAFLLDPDGHNIEAVFRGR